MRTEDRHERTELEPARVELAPFRQVGRVLVFITLLHRKAADVEGPIGQARQRHVHATGDLVAHVVPARDDVPAPHCHRIALGAGIALARKDEHALVVGRAVAHVHAMRVRQRVGVEVFGGRTQRVGRGACLALGDVQIRVHVRLVGVHPPGVEALAVELFVDLAPIDRLRLLRIRVVERVLVALADPVQLTHFHVALEHETGRVQFLVVGRGGIELGPDRNHDLRMHVVHRLDHAVRIGEVLRVEIVRAPGILGPVRPIQHDVVQRQLALAVFGHCADQLVLALVTLAALPEAVGPFGQHRRLAGERAVAGNGLIVGIGGDEVVVDHLAGFGPQRQVLRFGCRQRVAVQQRDIAGVDQVPFDLDGVALARLKIELEFVIPRIPVLAPAIDDQLAVHVQLGVLARIQREGVLATGERFDLALPGHLHAAVLVLGDRLLGILGQVAEVLVVHLALAAFEDVLAVDRITRGQRTGLALGVVQRQRLGQRLQAARVAQAGDRIVVPQQAVVAAGHQVRHRHVDVVLLQLDITALLVHPALLVLAEAVQRFVVGRLETLTHAQVLLALHVQRRKAAPAGHFRQHRLAVGIGKADMAIDGGDAGSDLAGLQLHAVALLGNLERGVALHRHAHQAGAAREVAVRIGADADDAGIDHLQAHRCGALGARHHGDAIGGLAHFLRVCGIGQQGQRQRQALGQ